MAALAKSKVSVLPHGVDRMTPGSFTTLVESRCGKIGLSSPPNFLSYDSSSGALSVYSFLSSNSFLYGVTRI